MKKIALVLLLVLLVTICGCTQNTDSSETTAPETPAGPAICWNIDRIDYVSGGRPVAADGTYAVRFAVNGEQKVFKVPTADMLSIIDFNDILVLEVDSQNVITSVKTVSEAGYNFTAQASFVKEAPTGSVVSCNTSFNNSGTDFELNLTDSTAIYDVSDPDTCGQATTLQIKDQITVLEDAEGNITHVFVTSHSAFDPNHTNHCVCCGNTPIAAANHTCDTTTDDWTAWSGVEITEFENLSGKYYLTQDVEVTSVIRIAGDLTICLNGHTLSFKYFRVNATSTLTVTDCSAEQTGKFHSTDTTYTQFLFNNNELAMPITINIWGGTITSVPQGSQGNVFALGSSMAGKKNILNIYNGTIQGCTAVGKGTGTSPQGGAIRISGTTECNMYGGKIIGGVAKATDSFNSSGGNVRIGGSAVFNMYGGIITGGTAEASATKTGTGGNLYLTEKGTVNLYGGSITEGTAPTGANIWVQNGTLNIVNVDETYSLNVNTDPEKDVVVNTQNVDSSVTVTVSADGSEYTLTKAAS